MDQISLVLSILKEVLSVLLIYWWLYTPFLLFLVLLGGLENYNKLKYLATINWLLLEVKVPQIISKSPKAMEQVFNAIHGIYIKPVKWQDRIFKGKVIDWFSFEVVGFAGDIKFYIRTSEQYKKLIESQIYAQYPEAEISQVEDYVDNLPPMPSDSHDLWGTELVLNKEDAFPIKTHPEFEEASKGPDDVKRIDPVSVLMEVLNSLEYGEFIGVQVLVRPTNDAWIKIGQKQIDKILGKEPKAEPDVLSKAFFAVDDMVFGSGTAEVKKEEKKPDMTPGKQDVLKAIERSFTKLGFESGIRFIYAGPKDTFHRAHTAGVMGYFKQFTSQSLNGFKMNKFTITMGDSFFESKKKRQEYDSKVYLLSKFKNRSFVESPFVLNTEELATIYHFPDMGVKTPLLPRVQAKKGEPPPGLPMG